MRRITQAEVATLVDMSESAFCHYFKRTTKKRYIDFVNDPHWPRLLLTGPKPANGSGVCYESSFHHWANFSKQFKALKQVSPSQYRKLFQA